MEAELSASLSRISRFAFPEFDDALAQRVRRDSMLNRFSQYTMQPKSFQHFTFSLQLQSGVRTHGHVRRYHPIHPGVKTRYDVGRRGERALVLLTRANGGDLVYSAVLKTLDAIICQKSVLDKQLPGHGIEPEQWFLNKLFDQHRHLYMAFSSLPSQDRKPMVLTVDCLEVGSRQVPYIEQADNCKFLIPTSLLTPPSSISESVTSSSILPLLRVLGVQNSLRLLSALLSESRILLVSSSPTRLAQCARSALSILAQGLLHWQHLYVPVLPPHLFEYLAAPVPYLIGMLTTLMPRLDQARSDGLGEMLIINLDTAQMETRGINPMEVSNKIPDLFRTAMTEQGMPTTSMSAAEMLAQDLVDLLKVDKRTLHGESALTNVSETAAKATKAVKAGLSRLKERGKKFLMNRTSSNLSSGSGSEDDPEALAAAAGGDDGPAVDSSSAPENTLLPDFIYTQGAQNEIAEEEARIAFASFFLSMFGNMRWYLSAYPGQVPQLDRQRFLQQKRAMGEGENTPLFPLLNNFCQTQMFDEFVKARVEEVRTRARITSDSPLFTQCSNHHGMHNVDFSVINVRRVARQIAMNDPARGILQTQARRTAMLLTSNKTYEGDYNGAVALLVEQCRECSSVLFDVMSVIWVRVRDSKGLHWKHGFQALQILRNLLYHGPLSAIAEATDGMDKIRVMKFYNDNMRSQICTQIRQVASQVYNLLVDRAKLYAIRRFCINERRLLRKQDKRYVKQAGMQASMPFSAMHKAFNPSSAKIAPQPGTPAPRAQFAAEQDLLGFSPVAPIATATPQALYSDPFGFTTPGQTTQATVPQAQSTSSQDLAGLFTTNVTVSDPAPSLGNPFETTPVGVTRSSGNPVAQRDPFTSPIAVPQQQPFQPLMPQAASQATPVHAVPAGVAPTQPSPVSFQLPMQPGQVATPQYQLPAQVAMPQGQNPLHGNSIPPQHSMMYGANPKPQVPGQPYQQPYSMPGQPYQPVAPQPSQYPMPGQPLQRYPPGQQFSGNYPPSQQQYNPQAPQQQKPNISQFDPLK